MPHRILFFFFFVFPVTGYAQPLLEMFTSATCPNCPAVEKKVMKLHKKGDVFALFYHVDYGHGWGRKDPDATQDNYKRQSRYQRTFGQDHVYTPMLVLNGQEVPARCLSARSFTLPALLRCSRIDIYAPHYDSQQGEIASQSGIVMPQISAQNSVILAESAREVDAEVTVVTYDPKSTKDGVHNTVRAVQKLVHWHGSELRLPLPVMRDPFVVFVQGKKEGPVLGWGLSN